MKSITTKLVGIMLAVAFAMPISVTPIYLYQAIAASNCNVSGLKNGTDKILYDGLCKMSKALGPVEVTSSCRTRKANRSVKKSYHLYHRGCRAADVVIKGVGKQKILNWWAANVGGGRGYYCGRRFVHVDTGDDRSWRWYCS